MISNMYGDAKLYSFHFWHAVPASVLHQSCVSIHFSLSLFYSNCVAKRLPPPQDPGEMTVKVPVLIKPLRCCHSGSVPGGTGGCFPVCALVPEVSSGKKSQFEGLWHGGRGEKALWDVDHSLPFPSTMLFLAVAAASQWVMGK